MHDNLNWHSGSLSPGDELRVQCIEAAKADEPSQRSEAGRTSEADELGMVQWRLAGCARDLARLKGEKPKAMARDLRALLKRFPN
jgi:hypothetical protein